MPPKVIRWPRTPAEFKALAEKAEAKFGPFVDNLQPYELDGLAAACNKALRDIRESAHQEDIRRGDRPPGTSVGRSY